MKLPKINIKTKFWEKELPEFKEATIGLIWATIVIFTLNTTIAIATNMNITAFINITAIIIAIIIIISYNKHKKEKRRWQIKMNRLCEKELREIFEAIK